VKDKNDEEGMEGDFFIERANGRLVVPILHNSQKHLGPKKTKGEKRNQGAPSQLPLTP